MKEKKETASSRRQFRFTFRETDCLLVNFTGNLEKLASKCRYCKHPLSATLKKSQMVNGKSSLDLKGVIACLHPAEDSAQYF